MTGPIPSTLRPWIPRGRFVGVSLILIQDGRLLFGLRTARRDGDRWLSPLTGIGGGLEDYDASLTGGLLRECVEETGRRAILISSTDTVVARGPRLVKRIKPAIDPRPAAIVHRKYRTPPHEPWHADNQGSACLVVYLGRMDEAPKPTDEHPAFLRLAPAMACELARRDMPLSELIASGAEVLSDGPAAVPLEAWTRLTDSQEALLLALGSDAPRWLDERMAWAQGAMVGG